ncbi:FAD-binding domain [Phytophthora infestans]|uniref:FAD-binding domain n=1 Tax=Phytophthora infestans TaxID=4787 RepID=A0A8S9TMF8_PHYIN|nr:FAD-binding domain [Phytophthora infestans]
MPPTEQRLPSLGEQEVNGETAVTRPLLNVKDGESKSSLGINATVKPTRSRTLNTVAHMMLVGSIAIYVWGQVMYLSPSIQLSFMNAISPFWSVPLTPPPPGSGLKAYGHYEMLAPTFFVLFTVLPLLASLIFFEFVRDYNVHRHTARRVLAVSALLRRKPPRFKSIPGLQWMKEYCYGELLFIAFLVVGNVVLFVYGWINQRCVLPRPGDPCDFNTVLELSGVVFGYSSVFNMAFVFLPFLHAIPFYWMWARQGVLAKQALPCFDCQLDYWHIGYPKWFNVFGEISLFFMLIVTYTSHPWVRRNLFEVFYYVHHLYIPAVIFAVLHFNVIVWWLLPTLVLYLSSRAISRWNSLFPVQFVYLNVPAISKLQWHAFTISSSPRTSPTSLTILAKSLGDWTQDLVQHAQECRDKDKLPLVYMDGYYGASLAGYDEYSTVCLIGGGIDATPLFAILEDMVARLEKHDPSLPKQHVVLILAIRELALMEEVSSLLSKIRHVAMLDTSIDYERLRGKTSIIQHTHAQSGGFMRLRGTPAPFIEPLRSRGAKIVLYMAMFVPITLLVLWLEFDNGVLMDHGKKTQYWPLQNFVEIGVVFLIPIVAYALLAINRCRRSRPSYNVKLSALDLDAAHCNYSSIRPTTPSLDVGGEDPRLRTLRDLVERYDVTCGTRPNMAQIMREVLEMHNCTSGTPIGVFISGPEALKTATDDAIADLGTHNFDVYEEEFEL